MKTQKTFRKVCQTGAKEILRDMAHDIVKGATIWPDAQKIERRWGLLGYTVTQVTWIEWQSKAYKAARRLRRVCFERDEIDRVMDACANDDLRDFSNIYGRSALNKLLASIP